MSIDCVYEVLCPDGKSRSELYRYKEKAETDAGVTNCGRGGDEDPCPVGPHYVLHRGISSIREVRCSMCGESCLHSLSQGIQELRSVINLVVNGGYAQSFPQDGESWTINLCEWCFGAITMICDGEIKKFNDIASEYGGSDYGAIAILKGEPAWRYQCYIGESEKTKKAISQIRDRCDRFLRNLRDKEMALESSSSNVGSAIIYMKYKSEGWFVEVIDKTNEIEIYCTSKPKDMPDQINGVPIKYIVG